MRREHNNNEEEIQVPSIATGDDMYLKEVVTFIDAIHKNDPSAIRSPYADSVQSYLLTHTIRTRAEQFESKL